VPAFFAAAFFVATCFGLGFFFSSMAFLILDMISSFDP